MGHNDRDDDNKLRKMSTNSIVLQSQHSISKLNYHRNSFNMLDQKSNRSRFGGHAPSPLSHNKFPSCNNFLGHKTQNGGEGSTSMNATPENKMRGGALAHGHGVDHSEKRGLVLAAS